MVRISPATALAAVLKSRLASAEYLRGPSTKASSTKENAAIKSKEKAEDVARSTLLKKLGTISKTDPDRRRKAFKYFLEGVLRLEFGRHMQDDEIGSLVDSTILRMQQDKSLETDMDSAGEKLLQTAHGR